MTAPAAAATPNENESRRAPGSDDAAGDVVEVREALRALRRGDFSVRMPVGGDSAASEIAEAFNEVAEALAQGELIATARSRSDEDLAEARNVEAMGQLIGGVAHDFNNLLTVVLGNIDIMTFKVEDEARRARRIDAVRHAAERGRDLTRQLLAFSRRQHLSPVSLNVNTLIAAFAPKLRQAVGDAVVLELDLAREPLGAHVDPAKLETVLLNLAVNARDAMPDGGRLVIATRREADLMIIEVRDNGVGMTPQVRERVFEPFFTTKEVGKGSGLGLAQVYGIIRQSEGDIRLESELGKGSTFILRLRACGEPADLSRPDPEPARATAGGERVLLVEDDPTVLNLTTDMLTGLGYEVTTATRAAEALEVVRSDAPIDLLVTDVVMPGGISGISLARTARELRPDLRVLLTSGFVGDSSMSGADEFPLLDKPYETQALAAKLRRLLDGPAHAARDDAA